MKRASGLPLVVLTLLLGGCNMVTMNPTGDIALQQRNLILLSVGLMLLIIVPVMVLTVLFAFRYRQSNPNKVYDPNFDHSTLLELVIWSCPLLIIIALSAVTWTSTHLLDPFRPLDRIAAGKPVPEGTKPLEVQVLALDWKWLFIYPELGVASVNELALPVDVPVHFSITSSDQFNTFFAPTLAGMIYAMPTMRSELNAVLNEPGESWGYSGNYTGRGYSDMRFKLRGVEQPEFDRWVAELKAGGTSLTTRWDTARFIRNGDAMTATELIGATGKTSAVQKYLAGLGEVPLSWPIEALKAQVVAARTYLTSKYRSELGMYKLSTTTSDQAMPASSAACR